MSLKLYFCATWLSSVVCSVEPVQVRKDNLDGVRMRFDIVSASDCIADMSGPLLETVVHEFAFRVAAGVHCD
jgi:hypothetical protein